MKGCFVGLALPPPIRQALQPLLADLAALRDPHAHVQPVPAQACGVAAFGAPRPRAIGM